MSHSHDLGELHTSDNEPAQHAKEAHPQQQRGIMLAMPGALTGKPQRYGRCACTLMTEGMPHSVSTSSMCSTSSARHMADSLPTRCARRGPSAGSRFGSHSATAPTSVAACADAAILSSRAAAALARPSTSCRALDQGPSVRACAPAHLAVP